MKALQVRPLLLLGVMAIMWLFGGTNAAASGDGECSGTYPNGSVIIAEDYYRDHGLFTASMHFSSASSTPGGRVACHWTFAYTDITAPWGSIYPWVLAISSMEVGISSGDALLFNDVPVDTSAAQALREQRYFLPVGSNVTVSLVRTNSTNRQSPPWIRFQWKRLYLDLISETQEVRLLSRPCTDGVVQLDEPSSVGSVVVYSHGRWHRVRRTPQPILLQRLSLEARWDARSRPVQLSIRCGWCPLGSATPPTDQGVPKCILREADRQAAKAANATSAVATNNSKTLIVVIVVITAVLIVGVVVAAIVFIRRARARDLRDATVAVAVDRGDIPVDTVVGTVILASREADDAEGTADDPNQGVELAEVSAPSTQPSTTEPSDLPTEDGGEDGDNDEA